MSRTSMLGGFVVGGLAVLALAAAVATLIGAITTDTQPRDSTNCARECEEGVHFTCLYEFEVDKFQTYSWHCGSCQNSSCLGIPGCIEGDGVTRLITSVNHQLPGPPIQVCEGDTVKVLVKNRLLTSGVSFHWHGMVMRDPNGGRKTPHMDGEPGVTQCPILPGSKFRYSFVANPAGTHFWHAQTGLHRGDGVFGSLIVKSPKGRDPNDELYDRDLSEHVVIINDWTHIVAEEKFFLHHHGAFSNYPKSILVNGRGPNQGNSILSIPHPVTHKRFSVKAGYKYRFRFINAGFLNCPVTVSIEDHLMTVIASDGSPVTPVNVTSFVIYAGERWDVILNANQDPGSYWMSFMGQNDCAHDSVYQVAVLNYIHAGRHRHGNRQSPVPRFTEIKPRGVQLNNPKGRCNQGSLCLTDLSSLEELPEALKKLEPDVTVPLMFQKEFLKRSLSSLDNRLPTPTVNGHIFQFPSTPVIFQTESSRVCPSRVNKDEDEKGVRTPCLHIIKIPLRSVTDLVLMENGTHLKDSSFHLHGHKFYVIAERFEPLEGFGTTNHTLNHGKHLNMTRLNKNLQNPVQKDTVKIPKNGLVVVRFKADNPGFWMLDSQLLFDAQSGMRVVFQVGEIHEIPKPPLNFPMCGDFL